MCSTLERTRSIAKSGNGGPHSMQVRFCYPVAVLLATFKANTAVQVEITSCTKSRRPASLNLEVDLPTKNGTTSCTNLQSKLMPELALIMLTLGGEGFKYEVYFSCVLTLSTRFASRWINCIWLTTHRPCQETSPGSDGQCWPSPGLPRKVPHTFGMLWARPGNY